MEKSKIVIGDKEFIIGDEYEFSNCLQKEKGFEVKWEKGILKGYLPVNGTSCAFHYNKGGISYYIREISPLNDVTDYIDLMLMTKHAHDNANQTLKRIKELLP